MTLGACQTLAYVCQMMLVQSFLPSADRTLMLQGSQDLQSPFSGDRFCTPDLIPAHHASPSRQEGVLPSAVLNRAQTLESAASQQSDLTPQQSELTNRQDHPIWGQGGSPDPGLYSSSSKSKLANLMQRFGQLKKSDRKADVTDSMQNEEGWGRGRSRGRECSPQVLTLDNDEDDDMVCMRSPSASPLPKRYALHNSAAL